MVNWDAFAGGMAKGLVTGARAMTDFQESQQQMRLRETAEQRAATRFGNEQSDRSDTTAAIAALYSGDVGGVAAGSASAQGATTGDSIMYLGGPSGEATLPPSARQGGIEPERTPEQDEVIESKAAGLPTRRAPVPTTRGPDSSGLVPREIPAGLVAAAKAGNRKAAALIESLRGDNREATKLSDQLLNSRSNRAVQAKNIEATDVRLDRERFDQDLREASKLGEDITVQLTNLDLDDNTRLMAPEAKGKVFSILDSGVKAYDKIRDGRKVTYEPGEDGTVVIVQTDEETGEVVSRSSISTVGELKALGGMFGRIANPETHGKIAGSALLDKMSRQLAPELEAGARAELKTNAKKSQLALTFQEFAEGLVETPDEVRLTPEYQESVVKMAKQMELLAPELVMGTREELRTDPDTGKDTKVKVSYNKLLEVAQLFQPSETVTLADGTTASAKELAANLTKIPDRTIARAAELGRELPAHVAAELERAGLPPATVKVYTERIMQQLQQRKTVQMQQGATPASALPTRAVTPQTQDRVPARGRNAPGLPVAPAAADPNYVPQGRNAPR